ncbi:MAG: phosphoribosylformylglycinamidine cyclo-ligase [Clostridia bacterium]
MSNSYKAAGVDVEAGYEAVKLMKQHVSKTLIPGVLSDIGGFGGLFEIGKLNYSNPVLVSGTDGVGTKLKIAFIMDKHDTVGQDCVAMCVNDIVCSGARPMFFLDYLAVGKNKPEKVAEIVKGVADGCVQAGCALIGGETAEMPGFYPEGEYDLAGFSVGIVDKEKIINGSRTKKGDLLIGLASSGIHSNGYSLVRKLFNLNGNDDDKKLGRYVGTLGCTAGEELLKPTRIYVKTLLDLIEKFPINAVSHITGGGFIENIPRMLPKGLKAKINKGSWNVLPIFDMLQSLGNVPERDMYNTFNMGIGMIMAVKASDADGIMKHLKDNHEKAFIIGEVIEGDNEVDIC